MDEKKSKSWLKPAASLTAAIIMAVTGASYAINPTLTLNIDSLFGSGGNQNQPTVINEPREAPASGVVPVGDVANTNTKNPPLSEPAVGGSNESPPIVAVGTDPEDLIEPSSQDPAQAIDNYTVPALVPAGSVDIAVITRDPDSGQLLTDVCYVLVDYSQQGCDENHDGQVTFAAIPHGTYTVRQTVTPAGYPTINDYEIDVKPAAFIDGTSADVPVGFVAKQAPAQNATDTRHVSIVTVDETTNEKIAADICVEIIGAGKQECDTDLADGQIDFLDVPVGGPYELRFDLPPDSGLEISGGPLAIRVDADEGKLANEIVFVQVKAADATVIDDPVDAPENPVDAPDDPDVASDDPVAASVEPDAVSDDPVEVPQETATLDITLRACPDHIMPQNVDPAIDCAIPIDGSDPAGVYWEGDLPGSVLLTQTERLGDGTYRTTVPANVAVSLRYLEPNMRDDYMTVGAHGVDHTGVPVITLNPGETANITLYYHYYVAESVVTEPPAEAVSPEAHGTTMRLLLRGCPDEGFSADTDDFRALCTTPLDAPGAAEITWGDEEWEHIAITSLERDWDGAYIFEIDPTITSIEISGLEPSVRDGFKVFDDDEVVESDKMDDENGPDQEGDGETFTFELTDDGDGTRDVHIYYYFD